MSRVLISFLLCLAFIGYVQASCTTDAQQLAQVFQDFTTRLASCNANDNTICQTDSPCRAAIRDYFAYVESCAEQISGVNIDFRALLSQYEALIEAACGSNPIDLANLYFTVCPNAQKLIDAAQNVLTTCPETTDVCSDACSAALTAYFKEIYACFTPGSGGDQNVEGLREVFENRCKIVSDAQSCLQNTIQNVHDINDKCSDSDGFVCSSECITALDQAASSASANCASGAADLLRQYSSACSGDCGTNLNNDWNSVTSACSALADLTATADDCTACANAIEQAITAADCIGTDSAAAASLNVLKELASQACTLDPAAKDLADSDVFSSTSLEVGTQCRAAGLCNSECQDAIDNLVSDVRDSYSGKRISVPTNVKDALNQVVDFCSTPFTGFDYRIRAVLDNIDCATIEAASFDYVFRLAQIFGLHPSNLIITDCSDLNTRATSASVNLGASSQPNSAKPSACNSVNLQCSTLDTSQQQTTSPGSSLVFPALFAVFGVIAWFF